MGGQQSSEQTTTAANGIPPLKHAIVLHGLRGSGARTIQTALRVKNSRMVRADERFLTTPPIFSSDYRHANAPGVWSLWADAAARSKVDMSVWSHGGRGSYMARWSTVALSTNAIVVVVDSTDRARLTPSKDLAPLPDEFVAGWALKTAQEQNEIQATLEARMDVKGMIDQLLSQTWGRRPLLVLATKQDLPGAMSPAEVCTLLDLPSMVRGRDWRLAGCDGLTGEGLAESVEWLNYVIAHPTDLSNEPHHSNRSNRVNSAWALADLKAIAAKERDARLDRGDIIRAPPLFHTNGQPWTVTPEQRAEFLVAPLTLNAEEKAELERLADPSRDVELAKRLVEPETASPAPSDLESEEERSRSSSSAVSSDTKTEVGSCDVLSMPQHPLELLDLPVSPDEHALSDKLRSKHRLSLKTPAAPEAAETAMLVARQPSFSSVSSSALPLPAPGSCVAPTGTRGVPRCCRVRTTSETSTGRATRRQSGGRRDARFEASTSPQAAPHAIVCSASPPSAPLSSATLAQALFAWSLL